MVNPLPILSDREIIARIQRGDEAAFQALFLDHYSRLCVTAARLVGSDAVAEELVQDVFLRLWDNRVSWEIDRSIAGYLTIAVRNHALNRLQRERIEHEGNLRSVPTVLAFPSQKPASTLSLDTLPKNSQTPESDLSHAELTEAVAQAIRKLPPRCRQTFILRRMRDLSYTEIAQVMGVTPKTVEVQMGIALKSLRKQLADWFE